MLVREIMRGGKSRREYNLVKNDPIFKDKLKGLEKRLPSVYASPAFILKLLALVALVGVSVVAYRKAASSDTSLKGFDPYELLGVDFNTPIAQIRKAYR